GTASGSHDSEPQRDRRTGDVDVGRETARRVDHRRIGAGSDAPSGGSDRITRAWSCRASDGKGSGIALGTIGLIQPRIGYSQCKADLQRSDEVPEGSVVGWGLLRLGKNGFNAQA